MIASTSESAYSPPPIINEESLLEPIESETTLILSMEGGATSPTLHSIDPSASKPIKEHDTILGSWVMVSSAL